MTYQETYRDQAWYFVVVNFDTGEELFEATSAHMSLWRHYCAVRGQPWWGDAVRWSLRARKVEL